MSDAKSGWYLLACAIGLLCSISYWYRRVPPEKRTGWLKIVFLSFFGIFIPGLFLMGIIALIRMGR
jgi:hypothetical protein